MYFLSISWYAIVYYTIAYSSSTLQKIHSACTPLVVLDGLFDFVDQLLGKDFVPQQDVRGFGVFVEAGSVDVVTIQYDPQGHNCVQFTTNIRCDAFRHGEGGDAGSSHSGRYCAHDTIVS